MEDRLVSCFAMYPNPVTGAWVEWYVMDEGMKRRLYNVLIDREREYRVLSSLEDLARRLAGMREARTSVVVVTDGWLLYRPNEGLAAEAGKLPGAQPTLLSPLFGATPMWPAGRAYCASPTKGIFSSMPLRL